MEEEIKNTLDTRQLQLIEKLRKHVTDWTKCPRLGKNLLEEFPDWLFTGKAYRLVGTNDTDPPPFDHDDENLSWTVKDPEEFVKHFIPSEGWSYFDVYEAEIRGFDVNFFCEWLIEKNIFERWYDPQFFALAQQEWEILAIAFESPVFVKRIERYKK